MCPNIKKTLPGLQDGLASFCEIVHLIQFVPGTQLKCESRDKMKASSDEMDVQ